MKDTMITVKTDINLPLAKVWEYYSDPKHIVNWNNASPDWHTPSATNDLRAGGKFTSRMEAKDGSFGFEFDGTYDEVVDHELIRYTMGDGRTAKITFSEIEKGTNVTIVFDAEESNPIEMQKGGWQAILDNFKRYTEKL